MYLLKKFHGERFNKFNTIISNLHHHLTEQINLIGSSTLPFPEICQATSLPGAAVRVEGIIGKRYFPATEPLDNAESLAVEGIRRIFSIDCDYEINIQPHSATQANHAIWKAILKPGDTVIGLSINDGGHISHSLGLPFEVSFQSIPVNSEGIDYGQAQELIRDVNPKMVIVGSSSYPLAIDYPALSDFTRGLGIHLHADIAHTAPFVAGGQHPNVFPYADSVTVDTGKNLRGPKGGILIYRKSISQAINRSIFPLTQSSPNQSAMIAKACLFEIWTEEMMRAYSKKLIEDSRLLSSCLRDAGIPIVYDTTDSHLILINTIEIGLTGKQAENILMDNKILSNRNSIPSESLNPLIASGLRIGTSTLTILNYEKADIISLANCISSILLRNKPVKSNIEVLVEKYHRRTTKLSD